MRRRIGNSVRRVAARLEDRIFRVIFHLTRSTNDDYGQVPNVPPGPDEE